MNNYFNLFKLVNILLLIILAIVFFTLKTKASEIFNEKDIFVIYRVYDGIYHPIMVASSWLAGILLFLLLFPSHIFKKWLFFVAPVPLFLTFLLVRELSVFSSGIMQLTRANMTRIGMMFLAIVTVLYIVGYYLYVYWKKQK